MISYTTVYEIDQGLMMTLLGIKMTIKQLNKLYGQLRDVDRRDVNKLNIEKTTLKIIFKIKKKSCTSLS